MPGRRGEEGEGGRRGKGGVVKDGRPKRRTMLSVEVTYTSKIPELKGKINSIFDFLFSADINSRAYSKTNMRKT